jgi:acetyl-CoA/propionyl-CoA/long-chain acyl-CoA carboxylase, biotin carboxylase, biotin carboxyl carrier protein
VKSVLIANRGEIAVRVIRAARELGLRTIAVYSELDRDSIHTQLADEAYYIGGSPAAESYLNVENVLEAARGSKADAIHPGYGFLAENAGFAQAVIDAGFIWVGPPPAVIATMGDKVASRKAATAAGVPSVPGTADPVESVEVVRSFAKEHGFPIAIKAAHGGGGKGLKVVRALEDLDDAFESARREADAWFSNPDVYVERYLDRPRHIEAQMIVDTHGTAVFLGDRDCSMQRRHQKLIEESPAPNFSAEQRASLAEAAMKLCKTSGYVNAGTIEFLLDEDGTFYFLEMNTRIQVEHCVTEMVTGIDLVKEQLRVARGDALTIESVYEPFGHAIEFRINAEDPGRNFLPTPGVIVRYEEPGGFGIRVDSGVTAGSAISQYYDNLIAKLVVWGRDRDEALERGKRALNEFVITGIATTTPAHLIFLDTDKFRLGEHYTTFVEDEVDLSGIAQPMAAAVPEDEELERRTMTVEVGGRRFGVTYWSPVFAGAMTGQKAAPRRRPPKLGRAAGPAAGDGVVTAPMQGTIVKVHHSAGQSVKAGEPIAVLEAMKMENEIKAPIDGAIVDLRVQPGDTVTAGGVIMIIK